MIIHQNTALVKYVQDEIDKFLTILRFVLNFFNQQKRMPLSLLC